MISSTGFNDSIAAGAPPKSIVIVPEFAAAGPPLTGPSTNENPSFTPNAAIACEVAGSDVDVSRMMELGWMLGKIFSITVSTTAALGSERMMTLEDSATELADATVVAPSSFIKVSLSSLGSKQLRAVSLDKSCLAMPPPMLPQPMIPICTLKSRFVVVLAHYSAV